MDRRQESGPLLTLQPSASPLLPPHDLNPASHGLSSASTSSRHLDISKYCGGLSRELLVQYSNESIRFIFISASGQGSTATYNHVIGLVIPLCTLVLWRHDNYKRKKAVHLPNASRLLYSMTPVLSGTQRREQ